MCTVVNLTFNLYSRSKQQRLSQYLYVSVLVLLQVPRIRQVLRRAGRVRRHHASLTYIPMCSTYALVGVSPTIQWVVVT